MAQYPMLVRVRDRPATPDKIEVMVAKVTCADLMAGSPRAGVGRRHT